MANEIVITEAPAQTTPSDVEQKALDIIEDALALGGFEVLGAGDKRKLALIASNGAHLIVSIETEEEFA